MAAVCPPLARDNLGLLTADNMDSLTVSTYDQLPGTVVDVACYIPGTYRLQGPKQVTCSRGGTWKPAVPRCVPRETDRDMDDVITEMTNQNDENYEVAIIITAIVVVIVLVFLVFIIVYRFYYVKHGLSWEKQEKILQGQPNQSFDIGERRASSRRTSTYIPYASPSSTAYNSVESLSGRPQILLRPALLERRWPGNNSTWNYLTADRLLRDMERSRRTNLWHTWRDFANLSTLGQEGRRDFSQSDV